MPAQTIRQASRKVIENSQAVSTPNAPLQPTRTDLIGKEGCPECGGTGYWKYDVPIGHAEFGKLHPCDCWKDQREAAQAERDDAIISSVSNMSDAEKTIRLDTIQIRPGTGTEAMLQACRQAVIHPAGFYTFWGGSGNAKTTALMATVNEIREGGLRAAYVTAFDLISYIRDAFDDKKSRPDALSVLDGSAYERILRLERISALAIDELDKIKMSSWVMEQLTDLIDKRYRGAVDGATLTMFAMNSDPITLEPHLASRIRDGRFVVVKNMDTDLRPQMRQMELGGEE